MIPIHLDRAPDLYMYTCIYLYLVFIHLPHRPFPLIVGLGSSPSLTVVRVDRLCPVLSVGLLPSPTLVSWLGWVPCVGSVGCRGVRSLLLPVSSLRPVGLSGLYGGLVAPAQASRILCGPSSNLRSGSMLLLR